LARVSHKRFRDNPAVGAWHLREILEASGYGESENKDITAIRLIIEDLEDKARDLADPDTIPLFNKTIEKERLLQEMNEDIAFRQKIEEYYLPKQLVNAIRELGEIPKTSVETTLGIAFIDIADYTFLSKFLSPKENQVVLNGLYTAFHWVIKKHEGYLNKIEGDSLMFHFGGILDPKVKEMSEDEAMVYISKQLFYTCIEMQRVCVLFNQANDRFIAEGADEKTRDALDKAFDIISMLRNNLELASSINALFQIRIRVGATIGEVTIGNFGPDGAKQWDVVGLPVIDAKRMETTSPVGGLRISDNFYTILEENGIIDAYYQRFRREAWALGGAFKEITKEDLFRFSTVTLKDKRDAEFKTYSVQVNPGLPEAIADQVNLLLEKGEGGAERILELLQYYRGNRYVNAAVEKVFLEKKVNLRKDHILRLIFPKRFKGYKEKLGGDEEKTRQFIDRNFSLHKLFQKFGDYQDKIKLDVDFEGATNNFSDYDSWFAREEKLIRDNFSHHRFSAVHRAYFYNVVYPLVFASIRASILEYQHSFQHEGELEEL
jgi:class 3 adenylate cyclase